MSLLIALITVAVCLRSWNASPVVAAAAVVSNVDARVDAGDLVDTCNLRLWYKWVLVDREKTSFQANIDNIPSSDSSILLGNHITSTPSTDKDVVTDDVSIITGGQQEELQTRSTAESVSSAAAAVAVSRVDDASDSVNTCNLRSWYMWTLADTHGTSFQADIDITSVSNRDSSVGLLMNANVSGSHYKFMSPTPEKSGVELIHQVDSRRSVTSRGQNDWLLSAEACLLSAKFSYAVCYYAANYHHVCLLNVSQHHVIDDDDARQHLINERSAAEPTDRAPDGHEEMTKEAESVKVNTSIALSNHAPSRPLTGKDNITHDVHSSKLLSAAETATKVFNVSSTSNATKELSATESNATATASNHTAESETTTKAKARTIRVKGLTPAIKLTTTKPTYEDIMKSVATAIKRKLNKLKISSVNTIANTSKPTSSSAFQPNVAKDEKPTTRKIGPSIKPAANTISSISSVKRIDYCQRGQTWFIVPSNEILSAAEADAKVCNATATRNATLELSAVEKNVSTAAASSPTVKRETTSPARIKATTTRGKRSSVKLATSKLTYEDLVMATGGKLRSPEVPKVTIKSNASAPSGISDNRHEVAEDAKSSTINVGPFIPAGTSTASSVSTVREVDYCQREQTWFNDPSKDICLAAATAAKVFKISSTRNAIQKFSTTKKNAIATASSPIATTTATRIKAGTARGNSPILSPVKLTTAKLAYRDVVKSVTSATRPNISSPKIPNVNIKSNAIRPTQLEIAKDAKPRTTKIGSSIPRGSSMSTIQKLDCCPHGQKWFTLIAESSTRCSVIRMEPDEGEKDRQPQPARSLAHDREEHDAEKHMKLMENDDTTNRHRYDVDDKCDQQLRLMEMRLLQLDNQLLQSNVDRITATAKLDNYVMRLELEFMRLNQSFVEVRTENEQLRQSNMEFATANNNADQQRKISELTNVVNNHSNLLVALQDKYAGLEVGSRQLVDQCELRSRPIETKLQQLENQLLQLRADGTTGTLQSVELENSVTRLESQLTELNWSFVEIKSENEHLRQRNLEISAATKHGDQQRKIIELTDILNNQSSLLVALQDKYAGLEEGNRQLVERLLNQSLTMNEMLLRIEALGAGQSRQALQLMEVKQSSHDQRSSLNRPSDVLFPRSPIDSTNDGHTPKDCYDHYVGGRREDSVLTIRPAQRQDPDVSAFCDMTQHGWTVIQRRTDGSVDFYRSWNQYKQGFGSISGEHWLGNEVIHLLTNQDNYSLRVSLTDWDDVTHQVDYDHFRVTDERDGYRLYVAGYRERPLSESGSVAGDSLLKHNGCRFSTSDVDNDQVEQEFEHGSCARRFTGAWWYYRCYMSNLNGRYYASGVVPDRLFDGVAWKSWKGSQYSLKRVEMKIRPARVARGYV